MPELMIKPSRNTPLVSFQENGALKIHGRSVPANPIAFFKPLIDWLANTRVESVFFEISLEYISSSSSKKLFEMLKVLEGNLHVKKIVVNWNYEEDDEDMLDEGQILSDSLSRSIFRFSPAA